MDLSPEEKSGLWVAEGGWVLWTEDKHREQSHKRRDSPCGLHKSEKGSVCTGGLMKEAGEIRLVKIC